MKKLRGRLFKKDSKKYDTSSISSKSTDFSIILNENKRIDYILLNWIRLNGIDTFYEQGIGEMIKKYRFGVLFVEKNEIIRVKSDELNIFYDITINGTLTVEESWSFNKQYGGYLNIYSLNNMILSSSGSINVTGMGYKGGSNLTQGESYKGLGTTNDPKPNYGGGGALRGGGGYGTKGENCQYGGIGGEIYGDPELTILYRGSGGGGGHMVGGNGGGIVYIGVEKEFMLNGRIEANGRDGTGIKPGGGSGGTILIQTNILNMSDDACIVAQGGYLGGNGRMRINIKEKQKSVWKTNKMTPVPYIG